MKNVKIYGKVKGLEKKKIHLLIKELSEMLKFSVESLEINFVNVNKIKKINSKYLNHEYSTDIITFNYSDIIEKIDGEIFISVEDAIENAKKYKVSLNEEMARLIIHGILHLLGFDDINKKDKIMMKRQENKLLNTLKFILL
jgi:rRNA maturation RNase YbeY